MTDEDPWVLFVQAGVLVKARPYCDCTREQKRAVLGRRASGHGSTRRHDGVWVMPCCMRPSPLVWQKHGDDHNTFTCEFCVARRSNGGLPTKAELRSMAKGDPPW